MLPALLALPLLLAIQSSAPDERAAPDDLSAVLEAVRAAHDVPALAGAVVTTEGLSAVGAVGVRSSAATRPRSSSTTCSTSAPARSR